MADIFPPPPPYEVNQREFDQKTSQAVEASLSLVDGRDRADRSTADEEWEYDEAAFEAAFQAALRLNAHGGGPQRQEKPVRPPSRQIDRKSSGHGEKERPSWYSEASFGGGSYTEGSSSSSDRPGSVAPSSSSPYTSPSHDEAPPPFRAEEYHGGESSPPSPLSSPPLANAPLQPRLSDNRGRAATWAQQAHPHSFSPPPARQPQRLSMGPRVSSAPGSIPPQSLKFDPAVAYNRLRNSGSPHLEAGNLNPSAFYK